MDKMLRNFHILELVNNLIKILLYFNCLIFIGTKNAKSKLKIVEFKLLPSGQLYDVENFDLFDSLTNLFPWMEYLVRASWTPDGRL